MHWYGLEQSQSQSQRQEQKLSQTQIQALNLLAMGAADLREEIFKAVQDNPALEIADGTKMQTGRDKKLTGKKNSRRSDTFLSDKYKASAEKTEKFQAMLEAAPDNHRTLRAHLMSQLNVMRLSEAEHSVGEKLIDNLDSKGFHILAPQSLLDKSQGESESVLSKMISVVQGFEPSGICCVNIEESLLIQAKNTGNAPPLAIFFLSGHLEMIAPPLVERVKKKLLAFKREQKKLNFAQNQGTTQFKDNFWEDQNIAAAIEFVKTLNPHPAADFGTETVHYVSADVAVTKKPGHYDADDFDRGIIVCDDANFYDVALLKNAIPAVRVAQNFSTPNNACSEQLQKATQFVNGLEYRAASLVEVTCQIVKEQKDFFSHGPGHLAPLTRSSLAQTLGLHVSTVSRLADSKYISCEWGLFPMKYFFETGVHVSDNKNKSGDGTEDAPQSETTGEPVAREKILLAIKNILESHATDGETASRISDAKLADMLAEKGIRIARRTVAKYRALLDIGSSYDR